MDRTSELNQQWNIPQGTDVVGAQGNKVGEVVAVQPNYIVVEKGFFFPTDYYIPTSAIANFDGHKVYLNVTKDEALHQGWDVPPAEREQVAASQAAPTQATAPQTAETAGTAAGYIANMGGTNVNVETPTAAETMPTGTQAEAANLAEGEPLRVPVREEELLATKRPVERGEVEVTKNVVTEEEQLDVPVTEERVRVERRVMDRPVSEGVAAFEGGTIEVPVRGEEVDVEKRVVQTGEVDITKEPFERTEHVADTVQREVVNVEESGTGLIENAPGQPGQVGNAGQSGAAGAGPTPSQTMAEGASTEEMAPPPGENAPWEARGIGPQGRPAQEPPPEPAPGAE